MSTENEKDFLEKVVDEPNKVEAEVKVVEVAKLAPKPKANRRTKKSIIAESKVEVDEVIAPVKKSTQFKKTTIKIMPGSYRSGIKAEAVPDKSKKAKKGTKIAEPKTGFDFS